MGSTDSYEKVFQIAARSEACSDLNSDDPNRRRKRKPNPNYMSSDSDETFSPHKKKVSHQSKSQNLLHAAKRVSPSDSDSSNEGNDNEFNIRPQKENETSRYYKTDLSAIRQDISGFKRDSRTKWGNSFNLHEKSPNAASTPNKIPQLPVGTL